MTWVSKDDLEKGISLITTDTYSCLNGHRFAYMVYSHPRYADNIPKCPICTSEEIKYLTEKFSWLNKHSHELIEYSMGADDYDTTPHESDTIFVKHFKGVIDIGRQYEAALEQYVIESKEMLTKYLKSLNRMRQYSRYPEDIRINEVFDKTVNDIKELINWRFK